MAKSQEQNSAITSIMPCIGENLLNAAAERRGSIKVFTFSRRFRDQVVNARFLSR
jgi:hypothetical protein